jgi:hypothetical protein
MFSRYDDEGAEKILNEWKPAQHGPLVQIGSPATVAKSSELQSVSGD